LALRTATHKPTGVVVEPPGHAIDVNVLRLIASRENSKHAEPADDVTRQVGCVMLMIDELALYDTVAALYAGGTKLPADDS